MAKFILWETSCQPPRRVVDCEADTMKQARKKLAKIGYHDEVMLSFKKIGSSQKMYNLARQPD